MKHAGTAFLVVMLLATFGLWGIAQQKNGAYASRLRDLENRYSKVEEEQRVTSQQVDRSQRRITQLEAEKIELTNTVEQLKEVVAERDELKHLVAVRSTERDDARSQVAARTKDLKDLRDQLGVRTVERDKAAQELRMISQDLQSMLGRVETALSNSPKTVEATPTSRVRE